MTPTEVASTMTGVKSFQDATPQQRNAFYKEMEIRQYGWDALTQAWAWFLFGWNSYTE